MIHKKEVLGIKLIFYLHSSQLWRSRKQKTGSCIWDCFSCKAYKATVILARSVLENIVNGLIGEARLDKPDKSKEKWRDKGLSKK